eukprot:gene34265-52728_t
MLYATDGDHAWLYRRHLQARALTDADRRVRRYIRRREGLRSRRALRAAMQGDPALRKAAADRLRDAADAFDNEAEIIAALPDAELALSLTADPHHDDDPHCADDAAAVINGCIR